MCGSMAVGYQHNTFFFLLGRKNSTRFECIFCLAMFLSNFPIAIYFLTLELHACSIPCTRPTLALGGSWIFSAFWFVTFSLDVFCLLETTSCKCHQNMVFFFSEFRKRSWNFMLVRESSMTKTSYVLVAVAIGA